MDIVSVLLIAMLFLLGVINAICWTKCLFLGFTSKSKVEDNVLKDKVEHVYNISNVGEPFLTLVDLLKSKPKNWDWWRDGFKYCKGNGVIKLYLTFEYEGGEIHVDSLYNIEVEGKYIYPNSDEKLYVKVEANNWLKKRLHEDTIKLEKLKAAKRDEALKVLQEELCG